MKKKLMISGLGLDPCIQLCGMLVGSWGEFHYMSVQCRFFVHKKSGIKLGATRAKFRPKWDPGRSGSLPKFFKDSVTTQT